LIATHDVRGQRIKQKLQVQFHIFAGAVSAVAILTSVIPTISLGIMSGHV